MKIRHLNSNMRLQSRVAWYKDKFLTLRRDKSLHFSTLQPAAGTVPTGRLMFDDVFSVTAVTRTDNSDPILYLDADWGDDWIYSQGGPVHHFCHAWEIYISLIMCQFVTIFSNDDYYADISVEDIISYASSGQTPPKK